MSKGAREKAKFTWTKDQEKAIFAGDHDVFVTAGAGSGKTAVLVRRALEICTRRKDPASLLDLVVVTFTEAAAAEMRGRLRKEIREQIRAEPENRRLRTLLAELDRAQISTIHSFCQRILRDHFHRLDLDPDSTVTDAEQARVLQRQVLDDVLERWYGDETEKGWEFRRMADLYGGRLDDSLLRSALLKVHGFLETLHHPEAWLAKVRNDYADASPRPRWLQDYVELVRRELERCRSELARSSRALRSLGIPDYADHCDGIREAVEDWLERLANGEERKVFERIMNHEVARLPTVRGLSPEDRETAKKLVEAGKGILKETLQKSLCAIPVDVMARTVADTAGPAAAFCGVVEDFRSSYAAAKRERAVLDFADLEQHSFRLLRAPESLPDEPLPSDVARSYHRRYRYLLVDEYQDTSPIQDAILDLVSRALDEGRAKNRFLVGDVKQCIYGFRQAEPKCFRTKIKAEEERDADTRGVIRLRENFRSLPEIIDGINELFRPIMREALGGVDYDEANELRFPRDRAGGDDKRKHAPAGPRIEFHFLERAVSGGGEGGEISAVEEGDIEADRREAIWLAGRVREMVGGGEFLVLDPETKEARPVRYRDIAVLLRTTKFKARVYADELVRAGVPVFADTQSGLLEAMEVGDLRSLLEVMENPRQDIPLAGVLRSPLIGWSETGLAKARLAAPEGRTFRECVAAAAGRAEDPAVQQKCAEVLDRVESWRERFRRERPSRALEEVLEETDYLSFAEGQPGAGSVGPTCFIS